MENEYNIGKEYNNDTDNKKWNKVGIITRINMKMTIKQQRK